MRHKLHLSGTVATCRLAIAFARHMEIGDTLLLSGVIGAGKSVFSRAFIRELCGSAEDVPSPSFTLVQTYECAGRLIWHVDLFRITSPDAVQELGLDTAFENAIILVEWPDRLGHWMPVRHVAIEFVPISDQINGRIANVTSTGKWDWLPTVCGGFAD